MLTDGPFESRDWIIAYENPQHSPEVMAEVDALIEKFSNVGLVDDLHDLMRLALHCDLEGSRFYAEFKRQQPEQYVTAMSHIARLGGL